MVRPASIEDGESLSPLLAQLGYPARPDEIRARLKRLLAAPDGGALVAEDGGEIVAIACFQVLELIYRPCPQCRITALVVHSDHRRVGTGTALVAAVERIARQRGCFRLELTTRPDRSDALAFYTALGFNERPHRFVKRLDDHEQTDPAR